jgi:hypothetical protein
MRDIGDLAGKNKLTELVARLNDTLDEISVHEGVIDAASAEVKATKHEIVLLAMDAGNGLNAIKTALKDDVGHGKFVLWLKNNFPRTPRTANKYMVLADGRGIIEAKIRTGSFFSITTALRLLKPPEPKKKAPIALADLSPEDRAQLIADAGQHIVAQERQLAERQRTGLTKLVDGVRGTLLTGAAPVHQLETIKALFEEFDDRAARTTDWRDRLAPESHYRMVENKVARGKAPTKPVITDAPPTDTKQ